MTLGVAFPLHKQQPRSFGKAMCEVEVLHGLTRRAFDDVILRAHDNQPAGPWVSNAG